MSKLKGRYSTHGSTEGEFEPGSQNRVLKNLLSIKRKRDMDIAETNAYDDAVIKITEMYDRGHCFTSADICKLHKIWLGNIYSWAGEYRNVNMSKGGFQFASAHLVPKLMLEFEKAGLCKYTPCKFFNLEDVINAIAIVHTEFILIHPFREGNGRLARLISGIMALQANLPLLNFESIKGKRKQEYIRAVQAGIDRNYEPMRRIFKIVIEKSVSLYEK